MYKVYWNKGSGAFLPLALLAKCGAPHERILCDYKIDANQAPDYLALNPMGQVPTLILPDGTVVTETAAMLLHLVDAFPEAGLAPPPGSSARAWHDRWVIFTTAVLYEADLRYAYPERYTADHEGAEAVKRAAAERLERSFTMFEDTALKDGPFVLGARFQAVDLYAAMLVEWFEPAKARAKLRHLVDTVRADKAYGPLWDEILA